MRRLEDNTRLKLPEAAAINKADKLHFRRESHFLIFNFYLK